MSDRPTGVSDPDDAFWCASATELLSKLGTTNEGLSGTEAWLRLQDATWSPSRGRATSG